MAEFTLKYFVIFIILQSKSRFAAASPYTVQMPEMCLGMKYCVYKHNDYPTELIESLLEGTEQFYKEYTEDFDQRIGPDEDFSSEDQCDSTSHMDPIYEIEDINGNIRFVVQSERLKQIIRIEKCAEPGRLTRMTKHLNAEMIKNLNLTCEECKLEYKFLVLGLDGESLETVNIMDGLPVCCSCRILESY